MLFDFGISFIRLKDSIISTIRRCVSLITRKHSLKDSIISTIRRSILLVMESEWSEGLYNFYYS